MGLLRLLVHHRERIPPGGLDQIHICGPEDLPWFARVYFSGPHLVIERAESESGRVFVPWRVGEGSPLLLGTATLIEREEPYLLEVELARGMVNSLRNQLAAWETAGLVVPAEIAAGVLKATSDLARAATSQDDAATAADWAQRSLETTLNVMTQLANEYAQQVLTARRNQARPLNSWFGVHLGQYLPQPAVARHVGKAFNVVSVPFTWRAIEAVEGRRNWAQTDAQIDWARNAGLRICAGPLLELDDRGLPDWTYLWEGDFDNLLAFMLDHVRAVIERYRGKVHLWQAAARVTHGHALGLSEEARLQLTAKVIATVRELDPSRPLVVTFDQPWAEYLAYEHLDLAPLHFADALVRADLGLSGLGLELNIGYQPGGSLPRGPLAISRLIDTWSLLELPLMVMITLPSSAADDPQASSKTGVVCSREGEISPDSQRQWIEEHVPMILAKAPVQIVLWNQLSDAAPHYYPHGGLFDMADRPKPALFALSQIRQNYLNDKK